MLTLLLAVPIFLIISVVLFYFKINKNKNNGVNEDGYEKLEALLQEETKKDRKKNVVVKSKKIKAKKVEKKEETKEEQKPVVSPNTPPAPTNTTTSTKKDESPVKVNMNKKSGKKNQSNDVVAPVQTPPVVVEKAPEAKTSNLTGSNKKTKKAVNDVEDKEKIVEKKVVKNVESAPEIEKEQIRSKRSVVPAMNDVNDAFGYLIGIEGIPEKCISLITDELDKLRTSVTNCNNKVASFEKQLKEKDATISKLKEVTKKEVENAKILDKLAEKDKIINNLNAKLIDFEEKYNILDDICRTRLTSSGNDAEVSALKSNVTALEKERDFLRKQVDSVQIEFGKLNNDYLNSVSAFKAQLDNCNHEINRLHNEFSLATEKGKNFERMYVDAESARTRLVSELQMITSEYNQTESQVKELQARLNTFVSRENETLQKSASETENIKAQFESYKNETEKIKAGFENTLNEMKHAISTLEMELDENKKENERLRNSLNEQDNLQQKIVSLTETIQKHKENHNQIAEFSEKAKELKIKLQNDIAAKDQETSRLKDLNKELIVKNINQARELQDLKAKLSNINDKDGTSKNSEKELAEASRRFNEVVKINESIVDAVKKAEENCQKVIAKTEAESAAAIKSIVDTTFDVLSHLNNSIPKAPKTSDPTTYKNWLAKSVESLKSKEKEVVEKVVERVVEKVVVKEVPLSNVSNDKKFKELEKSSQFYKSALVKLEKKLLEIERYISDFEEHGDVLKNKNKGSLVKHNEPSTNLSDCKAHKNEGSDNFAVDVNNRLIEQKSQETINGDEWEVVN
uniref:Ribosome-binding protein 1 (inferred by orthology to a human protein) n=1 Tax=Strongyloides venezuelensis TaxID=75913 RepID=A0A0K0FF86_STRVS